MSQPISSCMIKKAVRDEGGYQRLKGAMRGNVECGHYSIFGCECEHTPSCGPEPTPDQMAALNARLYEDLKGVKFQGASGMPCEPGPIGPPGVP